MGGGGGGGSLICNMSLKQSIEVIGNEITLLSPYTAIFGQLQELPLCG